MSARDARNKAAAAEAEQAGQAPADQADATAAGDTPVAVVPAPAPAAPDEHHGQGGLYVMKGGRRVLAERTQEAGAARVAR